MLAISSLPRTSSARKRSACSSTSVRRGEITEAVALERHERFTEMKMRLLGDRVSRRTAWKIAREQGWETTFDAEYLAVTKLQADAFVTIDTAMAAKAAPVVPLAPGRP